MKKMKTASGENALHFYLTGDYLSNINYNPNNKTLLKKQHNNENEIQNNKQPSLLMSIIQ
jgi:hypothetical protein